MLDSMLLRGSTREATESSKESSAAAADSSQRFLWCHCDHYCPTDSTNNTCRYGAARYMEIYKVFI